MELEVFCDSDSFILDELLIKLEPEDELVAIDVSDSTGLTFNVKGIENKVTGCKISDVQLWDS
jgi:hypothetical protein